jgi:hypothetical protein
VKIEFHPDFRIRPVFKIAWAGFKGLFVGFKFQPEGYPRMMRKAAAILALILVPIAVVLILARLL